MSQGFRPDPDPKTLGNFLPHEPLMALYTYHTNNIISGSHYGRM